MIELNRFPDFESKLFSKVIVVTGTARSGTTEISKIIASAKNTIYVNEPHILTLISENISDMSKSHFKFSQREELLNTYLFWSEVVPQVSGRTINLNQFDQTSIRSYKSEEDLQELHCKSWRFDDLREKFRLTNLVLKFVDNPNIFQKLKTCLVDATNVAIIRHPFLVAESALNRGYYQSPRLIINHQPFVRRSENGDLFPIFVNRELEDSWRTGSQVDRCLIASVAFLEELLLNRPTYVIKYEEISRSKGDAIFELMDRLTLTPTSATRKCIDAFFPEKQIPKLILENANFAVLERAQVAWDQISRS